MRSGIIEITVARASCGMYSFTSSPAATVALKSGLAPMSSWMPIEIVLFCWFEVSSASGRKKFVQFATNEKNATSATACFEIGRPMRKKIAISPSPRMPRP